MWSNIIIYDYIRIEVIWSDVYCGRYAFAIKLDF